MNRLTESFQGSTKRGAFIRSSQRSPTILYISPPWPYQSIRSLHIARALQHVGKVTVITVDAVGGSRKSVATLGTEIELAYELDVHARANAGLARKVRSLIDARSSFPHGIGVSVEGNARVLETMRNFDLVWVFKLRSANMFNAWAWPRSVLDIDDLPSGVYQTVQASAATFPERLRAALQAHTWKRRERLLDERFDVLAVCSENDKQLLGLRAPIHVIPNGFERPAREPVHSPCTPPRLGFVGLFEYAPNSAGMKWFLESCWPRIKARQPDVRLRLMGRGSTEFMPSAGPDIDRLGWVEDSAQEIASWAGMIVPVHMGGGTRVKIAEGFSRKCPVISTSVGAFGYDIMNGHHLRLADSAEAFASACLDTIRDPNQSRQLADRAWHDFLQKWTWDAIAPRVWKTAENCLRIAATKSP